MRSSLINEKIRNKDGKLTRFKTGWWFVFINISDRPLERTVNIGGFTTCLYTRNSRGLIHSRQRAPGAWREVISSPHVQTTSGAESAVRMVQSAMLSLCGGHKAVWDSKETPWSPSSGNPRSPGLQHQGTPDPQVSNAREPSFQHETSDNKASRDDEDQWGHPQLATDECHQNSQVRVTISNQ